MAGTPPRRLLLLAALLGLAACAFYQLGVPLRASHGARVTGDEPFYLLTTVSLLEDGDLDLANDYALRRYRAFFDHPDELWHQSVPTEDGRLLSPHNPGLSLLSLPAYALGGVDGVKAFLGCLAGLTVFFAALLAHRATGHVAPALAAAALLAGSAPLFVYATQVYPEAPAALAVTASLWLLLAPKPGLKISVALACAAMALLWLGVKYAPVAGVLTFAGVIRFNGASRLVLLALLGTGLGSYAWFNLSTFGGLTPYGVNRLYEGNGTLELLRLHFELWNRLYRLAGLWIDGEFGLLRWAPALILALPGIPLFLARRAPGCWAVAGVFSVQLLIAAFFSVTMRGWWFPGRMLIAVLPLLAIPLAETLALTRTRPWMGAAGLLLGAYTLAITVALVNEAQAEVVVLAVDPFALAWPPFRQLAGLFPVYTDYGTATWALTALWLLLVAGLVVVTRPLFVMRALARRGSGGPSPHRAEARTTNPLGGTAR